MVPFSIQNGKTPNSELKTPGGAEGFNRKVCRWLQREGLPLAWPMTFWRRKRIKMRTCTSLK
jgi:hypothetical protein